MTKPVNTRKQTTFLKHGLGMIKTLTLAGKYDAS